MSKSEQRRIEAQTERMDDAEFSGLECDLEDANPSPDVIKMMDEARRAREGEKTNKDNYDTMLDAYEESVKEIARLKRELEEAKKAAIVGNGKFKPADPNCENCNGLGWYGDNGPGVSGNREYQPCECTYDNPDSAEGGGG